MKKTIIRTFKCRIINERASLSIIDNDIKLVNESISKLLDVFFIINKYGIYQNYTFNDPFWKSLLQAAVGADQKDRGVLLRYLFENNFKKPDGTTTKTFSKHVPLIKHDKTYVPPQSPCLACKPNPKHYYNIICEAACSEFNKWTELYKRSNEERLGIGYNSFQFHNNQSNSSFLEAYKTITENLHFDGHKSRSLQRWDEFKELLVNKNLRLWRWDELQSNIDLSGIDMCNINFNRLLRQNSSLQRLVDKIRNYWNLRNRPRAPSFTRPHNIKRQARFAFESGNISGLTIKVFNLKRTPLGSVKLRLSDNNYHNIKFKTDNRIIRYNNLMVYFNDDTDSYKISSVRLFKFRDAYYLEFCAKKQVDIPSYISKKKTILECDLLLTGVDLGFKTGAYCATSVLNNGHFKIIYHKGVKAHNLYRWSIVNKLHNQKKKLQSIGANTDKIDQKLKNITDTRYKQLAHDIVEHALEASSRYKIKNPDKEFKNYIILEDVNLFGTTKQRTKYKNIVHCRWNQGKIIKLVEMLANRHGICVQLIQAAYTSKICSKCGSVGARYNINDDKFTQTGPVFYCATCDYQYNSDFNAAINISRKYFKDSQYNKLKNLTKDARITIYRTVEQRIRNKLTARSLTI